MFSTLLVDGNVCYRQTLSDVLLLQFPYIAVDEAGTGMEAPGKAAYQRPDLIFMDICLTEENGLQVSKEIKRIYGGIVVVILSGKDQPEYRQQATRNGVDHCLSKQDTDCIEKILARVNIALARESYG